MRLGLTLFVLLAALATHAQSVYRYKDEQGRWQYSDRPPVQRDTNQSVEQTNIKRSFIEPTVKLEKVRTANGFQVIATNTFYCPVQLVYEISQTQNVADDVARDGDVILDANSRATVIDILPADSERDMGFEISFRYLPGATDADHAASDPYRVPFAVGNEFPVTQAWPLAITHTNPSSEHAIDIALPVGTAIYAARGGTVFEVAYNSYSGGTTAADMPKANVVRIVHEDGTMAVYAHLAWNSIRVKPGQPVQRGQYIADSGNTGFSSGPHLHFAVQRNTGLTLTSLPVTFRGPSSSRVKPAAGKELTAY